MTTPQDTPEIVRDLLREALAQPDDATKLDATQSQRLTEPELASPPPEKCAHPFYVGDGKTSVCVKCKHVGEPEFPPPPAPLSDEDTEAIENILSGKYTHTSQRVLAYLRDAIEGVAYWKQRAEEEERALAECQHTHGSRCGVDWANWKASDAAAKSAEAQLSDIRTRLGGSPGDKLDGDDGLVAKLKAEEERLTLLAQGWYSAARMRGLIPGHVAIDDQGNGDPFYPRGEILGRGETAQLREENERLQGSCDAWQSDYEATNARLIEAFEEKRALEEKVAELEGSYGHLAEEIKSAHLAMDQALYPDRRPKSISMRVQVVCTKLEEARAALAAQEGK